jgi:intracellular multiplication protein IcmO
MDEYGYYAVKGFAVVPAQARSLGFSAVFAGQDLPAFQKASKEEAASIGANTNIKICMKLEDPVETWEFFLKTAGEAYVTKVDSFQTDASSMTNTYNDTRSASVEKRARIDLLDLKDQREGESHIFFKSKIVRAKMFYAAPKPVGYMRLNQYLRVDKPPSRVLLEMQKRFEHFQQVANKVDYFASAQVASEEITSIAADLSENEMLDPIERSISALLAYQNKTQAAKVEQAEVNVPEDMLNIFTKMRLVPGDEAIIIAAEMDKFSAPLLIRGSARDQIESIERSSGKMDKYASNIADEIVKDMEIATRYPPEVTEKPTPWELTEVIDGLIGRIQQARQTAAAATETST